MANVIAVSITKLYEAYLAQNGRQPSDVEFYDMTRWAWRGEMDKISQCGLAFACLHGEIVEVYEVQEWFTCGAARTRPELRPQVPVDSPRYAEIERDIEQDKRKAFVGRVADIAQRYRGTEAPRLCGPIGYTTVSD